MRFLKILTLAIIVLAYACGSKYETGVDPSPPTTTSCLNMNATQLYTGSVYGDPAINLEIEFNKLSGYSSTYVKYVSAVAKLNYYGGTYCCGNTKMGMIILNDGSWMFNDSSEYGGIANMVLQCVAITPYSTGSLQLILAPYDNILQKIMYLKKDRSLNGFIKIRLNNMSIPDLYFN